MGVKASVVEAEKVPVTLLEEEEEVEGDRVDMVTVLRAVRVGNRCDVED